MKVFLASDHAGFELKAALLMHLRTRGYEAVDCGPERLDPLDDYPQTIAPMAKKVAKNKGSFGIAIGLSGQGEAMESNRTKGVRAAVYYGSVPEIVRLAREHNDANVLSLAARFLSVQEAKDAVDFFLSEPFSHEERHARRIKELG